MDRMQARHTVINTKENADILVKLIALRALIRRNFAFCPLLLKGAFVVVINRLVCMFVV